MYLTSPVRCRATFLHQTRRFNPTQTRHIGRPCTLVTPKNNQQVYYLYTGALDAKPRLRSPPLCTPCAAAQQQPLAHTDSTWRGVVAACSASTFLAALQRVALPAVAILLLDELSLGMDTMGAVQASVLAGYLLGQIPSGTLADRYGGLLVLTIGLALWSAATACIATTASSGSALLMLIILRGLVGLGQSCMMPSVAATVARCVPASHRASSTSVIYACFSLGTVVGLAASTPLAEALGWQGVFALYGGVGMAAAVCG